MSWEALSPGSIGPIKRDPRVDGSWLTCVNPLFSADPELSSERMLISLILKLLKVGMPSSWQSHRPNSACVQRGCANFKSLQHSLIKLAVLKRT